LLKIINYIFVDLPSTPSTTRSYILLNLEMMLERVHKKHWLKMPYVQWQLSNLVSVSVTSKSNTEA